MSNACVTNAWSSQNNCITTREMCDAAVTKVGFDRVQFISRTTIQSPSYSHPPSTFVVHYFLLVSLLAMKKTSRNGKWNSSLYHTQQLKALFTTSPVLGSLEGQDQKGGKNHLRSCKRSNELFLRTANHRSVLKTSARNICAVCWIKKKNCQPQSNLIWTDWNIFLQNLKKMNSDLNQLLKTEHSCQF